MGCLNDLLVGVPAQEPRGQDVRSKLGLGMPRGHVDDQTLEITIHDPLECLGHDLVMTALNKRRPHKLNEVQVLLAGFLPRPDIIQPIYDIQHRAEFISG